MSGVNWAMTFAFVLFVMTAGIELVSAWLGPAIERWVAK